MKNIWIILEKDGIHNYDEKILKNYNFELLKPCIFFFRLKKNKAKNRKIIFYFL